MATVHRLDETTSEEQLSYLLPKIDVLLVFSWPRQLTPEKMLLMTRLRLVQNILAGVNQVPFKDLSRKVTVCSNAGAYSTEVGEYAMGLLLAAAKSIVESDNSIKQERWNFQKTMDVGSRVTVLEDKILGILGYGGIGGLHGNFSTWFPNENLCLVQNEATFQISENLYRPARTRQGTRGIGCHPTGTAIDEGH